MSRASITARGQAAAEAGMADTCVIRRIVGTTTDDFSGVVTHTYASLYTGRCRVQQSQPTSTRQDVGQDSVVLSPFVVAVPMTVTGVEVNDEVTITTSRDPDLIGRLFYVESLAHKTDATARRLGVKERIS